MPSSILIFLKCCKLLPCSLDAVSEKTLANNCFKKTGFVCSTDKLDSENTENEELDAIILTDA